MAPCERGQFVSNLTFRSVGLLIVVAVALILSPFQLSASAGITYVQSNYGTPQTPQNTVNVTFTGPQTAGDLNVLVVGWNDTSAVVNTVSDSSGNNYALAAGPTVISGTASQSIYYAKNINSAVAGTNTVTVTFTIPAVAPDIRILEYAGADLVSPIDVTMANVGNGSQVSSGSVTTTNANDLIFGADYVQTLTLGPGTGFSERQLTLPDGDIAEDEEVTEIGSYTATALLDWPGYWIMQMVAFRSLGATITSLSPNSGPTSGGTPITITGTDFGPGSTVKIGGNSATDVTVVSPTEITATTPAGTTGPVAVAVSGAGQTATLANGFTYVAAAPQQIAFVQANYKAPQGNIPTVSVPFTQAQTASDLNVIVIGWNDSTSRISSVVDSVGNTYSVAGTAVLAGNASQSIYYAKNILAATAGANTVTVAFNAAASSPDVQILEYSGADPNTPLDVFAGATGNSANSSVALTTNFSDDIVVAGNFVQTLTVRPGIGFTERILSSPNGDIAEDAEAATVGTYTAAATLSGPGYWVATAAAFKGNSSGVPPQPTYGISGTVTGSAATLLLGGASTQTVNAASNGTYTFSGLSNGTYTVTPSESGYTFNPLSATVTINNASVTGISFAGSSSSTPHSVALTWVASTTPNVVSYNIYRATGTGSYSQIASGITSLTYTDTNVTAGASYSYAATAVDNTGTESNYSNIANATIPTP